MPAACIGPHLPRYVGQSSLYDRGQKQLCSNDFPYNASIGGRGITSRELSRSKRFRRGNSLQVSPSAKVATQDVVSSEGCLNYKLIPHVGLI